MSGTWPSSPAPASVLVRSMTVTRISDSHSLKRQRRGADVQRWGFSLAYPPLSHAAARDLWGFMVAQAGQAETFSYVLPSAIGAARGVATGSPAINGAGQTGASLVTDGWTAGVTGILLRGDLIKLAGDTKVYMVTTDANSDGSGNATLSIFPPLLLSPADDAVLTPSSPTFQVSLGTDLSEITFSQVLAGGLDVDLVEVF